VSYQDKLIAVQTTKPFKVAGEYAAHRFEVHKLDA